MSKVSGETQTYVFCLQTPLLDNGNHIQDISRTLGHFPVDTCTTVSGMQTMLEFLKHGIYSWKGRGEHLVQLLYFAGRETETYRNEMIFPSGFTSI